MIAKMILPWFGGASAVWSTCMLFFQIVLLVGYLWGHWLQNQFRPRTQAMIHSVVLALSLLALPIIPNPSWKPAPGDNPSLRILGLLIVTVGLPYFLVSTTSPLIQAWYARTHRGVVPYRLFALSNLASMLALLSYPLVFEPALTTRFQANTWSVAYGCFVVLCGATAWLSARMKGAVATTEEAASEPPSGLTRVLWVVLPACASILLLSLTTFLTQDVAAIPFLWVLPLVVYLLSFILCFNTAGAYNRAVYMPLVLLALALTAYRFQPGGWRPHMVPTIVVLSGSLFVYCMFCHGELVRLKPHARYLTGFYVALSLGGAVGGLFVGLIAPNFFNAYYEFPFGLAMCAALLVFLAPQLTARWKNLWRPALFVIFCGFVGYLGWATRRGIHDYLLVERNFYGQLRVRQYAEPDEEPYRMLIHGLINHGEQLLAEQYRKEPITYFCRASGIGQVMSSRAKAPQRVGIMGMGCGTLAAYGRPGDTYRFYEINALVPPIARTQFTYIADSAAKVEVALGDARLSLEHEPDQQFDLLVMDAFSGDSVPVHLITREALQLYFRHLKPGGLLAVNISNNYLDMRPVLERAASSFHKIALYYSLDPSEDDLLCYKSGWVVIADPTIRQTSPEFVKAGEILSPIRNFRVWTDDYSSLWGILK